MSGQLVEQWPLKKLNEICDVSRGKTITRKETVEGDVPVVAGGINSSYSHNTANRPANVITVSGSGANAGFVNFWATPIFASDCSTILPLDPKMLDVRFVYYAMLNLQDYISKELRRGAAQPHVYAKDLALLEIPVPSLEEQQRIVRILDDAFINLTNSDNQLNQKIINANEIYQTSLSSTFAKNEDWESGRLGDVSEGVQTGPFGSLLHKSDYIANGIPIVNPAHITERGIVADENKTISVETASRLSNYLLKPQYVVIGRRGEMGRCAVVNEKEEGWLCGTGSFFIKPSERIDSYFLVKLLWSERYRKKLNEIATGATMKNLSNKALSNLVIEFPSRAEQHQIVERLDNLFSEIEMLKQTYSLESKSLEELKQSILQEAFNGTLRIAEGLAGQS